MRTPSGVVPFTWGIVEGATAWSETKKGDYLPNNELVGGCSKPLIRTKATLEEAPTVSAESSTAVAIPYPVVA